MFYLRPYDPADLIVLEKSGTDRNGVWSLWQTPEYRKDLWDFGTRLYHHLQTTILPLKGL